MTINKERIYKMGLPLIFLAGAAFFLMWEHDDNPRNDKQEYYHHTGNVFGTYYNIRYSSTKDYEKEILEKLADFDGSMSTFNPQSTISLINTNQSDTTDFYFEQMYAVAQEVSILSNGAFDITVASLVNAWGFGFRNKETVTPELIDSLRGLVGYKSISVNNHKLSKNDPRTMIDASAIAKGQACDVVAQLLTNKGCKNMLVDIGGEVVCKGVSDSGKPWRIGITKPQDDPTGTNTDLQEVISSTDLCMATSGNYRQFYYDGDIRRSHTIDPRTGYPAESDILSATIIAPTCMLADALATACMVLGSDSALAMIDNIPDANAYLICSVADKDTMIVITTPNFPINKQ
mgnify:FL=1